MKLKLNIPANEIFYKYLYPIFAKEFLFRSNYENFANLIQDKFDLTLEQWEAVLQAWEEKESILKEV
jgi:hypothetical protein